MNLFTVNRYYIKPPRRFSIAISQQKELCSLADTLLFAIIYCCRCISAFFIASILHFYKYQILSVSNDQVNFSAFAAKILCYNKKTLFFQKGSRLFFMAAAYFTFINAQICSLISYLCVGILCNLYEMCNKTCPVDRCWSIFLKRRNMFCRAIPFIRCKTIFRHSLVIFHHQTVSRNFCYNT